MSRIKTRRLATVGLAAAIVLGSGAGAMAASGSFGNLYTNGASFVNNYVYWYPKGTAHGGMRYSGTLKDTKTYDGYNVFVHGKVEGYSYGPRLYGPGYKSQTLYDPSATYVSRGWVQVCTDRGTALWDYCTTSQMLYRW